jgi:uncharacterized LabA/DUF88 family protein
MVFIDHTNFTANFKCIKEERKQDRWIDFYKIGKFVVEYLSNNPQYRGHPLIHIRTYLYTGVYTDQLIKRIKDAAECASQDKKPNLTNTLNRTTKYREVQKKLIDSAKKYSYFEIRGKPLQFAGGRVFQKGVDVQLAVDLVSNAYQNNFDIAVLFSGDIDLLESIKTVKNLGKHVILFSHYSNMAKDMIKEPDWFIDLQHLKDEHLDKFSHVFQPRTETGNVICLDISSAGQATTSKVN